ncbi:hypothetical protein K440DRAFT_114172 [Wilcoxina mikolae CBS 423.85]|nr:hypothetical protein K440DRAFT_114172 [Wilcoxina mikolae CBS 423.85]
MLEPDDFAMLLRLAPKLVSLKYHHNALLHGRRVFRPRGVGVVLSNVQETLEVLEFRVEKPYRGQNTLYGLGNFPRLRRLVLDTSMVFDWWRLDWVRTRYETDGIILLPRSLEYFEVVNGSDYICTRPSCIFDMVRLVVDAKAGGGWTLCLKEVRYPHVSDYSLRSAATDALLRQLEKNCLMNGIVLTAVS